MKNPKYQVYTGANKKVYFRLKSGNGQVVLQSQGYKSKAGATAGIASVKAHARSGKNFEVKQAKNGKYHFNLISKNKQVVGSSQMYTEKRGCTGGMNAVKKNSSSKIEDLT
ncbi:MAG: YegP family protein [Ignavibacteria bacterium]|nr:YegP family protein [Ignavibacteria bacterium]